jgi:WD40 repeat protein
MRVLQNTRTRPVIGVDFGPDGRTLVAGGGGGFDVWDLSAGLVMSVAAAADGSRVVLDPLGRWLYFFGGTGGCSLYGLSSWKVRGFPSPEHRVLSVAAAPDGSRVVLSRGKAGRDRLECWAIAADGGLSLAWTVSSTVMDTSFHGLAFHPQAGTVAAVERRWRSTQGESRVDHPHTAPAVTTHIALRSAVSGEQRAEFGATPSAVALQTMFVPDGERLIVWSEQQITVWDTATGTQVHQASDPEIADVHGLAVHPSGQFFLTAGGDGQARFWDAQTLQQTRAFRWRIGKLHSVAFSRDGMLAAAGGDKGQVVVWDVEE